MSNSIDISEDHVIHITYDGDQTVDTAKDLHQRVSTSVEQLHKQGFTAHILVDVSKLGAHDVATQTETIESIRSLPFERMAIIGANPYTKHIGNFIIRASGKSDLMQYVDSTKDVEHWFAKDGIGHSHNQGSRKILIVDSNSGDAEIFRTVFDPTIYELLYAETVDAAETILSASTPDVIILDVMLSGGKNGFDFLKELRRDKCCVGVPIVIFTTLEGEEKTAHDLGASLYLLKKNVKTPDLPKQIESLFQQ